MYSHHSAPKSDSPRNLRVLSFSALDFSSAPSSSSLHQSRITRHQPLSLFLSYFSKLFGTHQKRNPFVFKQIRTLSQKHPGWGYPHLSSWNKMKPQTSNSAVLSTRCTHRTSGGRQCRLSASDACSGLRPQRRAEQKQVEAADQYLHLIRNFQWKIPTGSGPWTSASSYPYSLSPFVSIPSALFPRLLHTTPSASLFFSSTYKFFAVTTEVASNGTPSKGSM